MQSHAITFRRRFQRRPLLLSQAGPLLDFEPEVGEDYCNLLCTLPGGRTQDYIPGTKRLTIWSPKSTNWTRRQDEVAEGMVSWLCRGFATVVLRFFLVKYCIT